MTTNPIWILPACRPGTTAAIASGVPTMRSSGICDLFRHEPHKPVINLEAMYDGQGVKGWQAVDARSLAWRSWLSGAVGYTYGAGDLPPKCPQGSGAVWMWVTDSKKYDYWGKGTPMGECCPDAIPA